MSLPAGWAQVPLNPHGGFPQAVPLPTPDSDLRLIVVGMAADLAATLGAAPEQTVWTSADQLSRRPAGAVHPGDRDIREIASSAALDALMAPPKQTLSAAESRVVVLVLAGQRVIAASPPVPGRALPVFDGNRLRGHMWVDDVTVTAGSFVSAGPTGTRVSIGWQTRLSAGITPLIGPMDKEEDPYDSLV